MTAAGSVSTMDRQQSDELDLVSSLAPALQELDHLLENPTRDLMVSPSEGGGKKKSNKNSGNDNDDDDDDDDDSLDQELSRLAASEQLLRQELEFAHNFGALLDSGGLGGGGGEDWMQQKKSNSVSNKTWTGEEHKKDTSQSSSMDSRPEGLVTSTSIEYDSIAPPVKTDTSGLPKSPPPPPPPPPPATVPSVNGHPPTTSSLQTNDATAAMRVDAQTMEREPIQQQRQQQQQQKDTEEDGVVSAKSSSSAPSSPRHAYTLENHSEYLGIQTEARGGWYHLPHFFPTNKNDATALREYIIPLPDKELQRLYVGIVTETQQPEGTATITSSVVMDDHNNNNAKEDDDDDDETPEANATAAALTIPTTRTTLPLRVVTMRIRPDVLVGAVMEALAASATDCGGDIHKRQGGHLVFSAGGNNNNNNNSSQQHQHNLLFDCQAVTYKGSGARYCQRTLLIRVYRNHGANNKDDDDDDKEGEDGKEEEIELQSSTDDAAKAMLPLWEPTPLEESSHGYLVHPANTLLQEAAALVQKMETSKRGGNDGFFSNSYWRAKPVYPSKLALQTAVSQQLLATYKPCPSVQEGRLTLPSLSKSDFPLVKLSWKYIQACWNELEERDLTYASLGVAPFGRFPALLTLDNHYCSQLRRLCRETMIVSLLKAASELEQYARESEYACANLCQALQPTVDTYGLVIPALVPSLPLTAYPLDFVPHAAACPPWGQRVIEALNQIQALDDKVVDAMSGERAEQAVRLVLVAFQKQDDEEQSARLGRKNLQVMDRLAKIQTHKRTLIETLHYSYSVSAKAQKAAHELYQYVKKYYKSNEASSCPLAEAVCVPLLKSSILVGGATGTVYVTATHLLCVTQLIPIVGGNKIVLESLEGLTFEVVNAEGDDNNNNNNSNNNSKTSSSLSLLNPLPTSITLHRRRDDDDDNGSRGAYKKVYSFRPSYGASRLKTLLEVLQTMQPSNQRITKDGNSQRYVYGDVQE